MLNQTVSFMNGDEKVIGIIMDIKTPTPMDINRLNGN